jgi:hypothetical protein
VATPLAAAAGVLAGLIVLSGHVTAEHPMNWLMISNGLFAACPLCILALLHVADDANESGAPPDAPARARRLLFGISLAHALVFAAFVPEVNSRGIHWGNRFLLPLYPLLAVLASVVCVAWWQRLGAGSRVAKAAVGSLLLVSLLLQLYSLLLLHDRKVFTAELNDRVAESAETVVIVDTWFLGVDLARIFYDKSIFLVHGAERGQFRARARAAGVVQALSLEKRRRARAGDPGDEVLDDGWLDFSPVVLRTVRFPGGSLERQPTR